MSSNPVYQRELHKIYLAWSDKLWQAKDWSSATALLQKGIALDYERTAFYPRLLHTLLLQGQWQAAEAQWAAWQVALSEEEQVAFREVFLKDFEWLRERKVLSGEMEERYEALLETLSR
ncbi:MAG: hypothetical protein AAGI49_05150 [Bacteroidota bacterium]